MKKYIILIAAIGTMASCGNNKIENTSDYTEPTIVYSDKADSISTKASINMLNQFLHSYKDNYDDLNKVEFIIEGENESKNIDFDKLVEYQETLKKSGFFSKQYFEEKLIYFTEVDSRLASGDSYAFAETKMDPVLFVEDYKTILNNISNLTYTAKKPHTNVIVTGTTDSFVLTAEMVPQDGAWKINNIYTYFK